jgi:hypothetical protein
LLNWNRDPLLKCLKMLAWAIYKHEHVGTTTLWQRANDLCKPVTQAVIGKGWTLRRIIGHTLKTQGIEITPARLAGRANKAERYGEFNDLQMATVIAYRQAAEPSDAKRKKAER